MVELGAQFIGVGEVTGGVLEEVKGAINGGLQLVPYGSRRGRVGAINLRGMGEEVLRH
jgi:hypothetical protein